MMTYRQWVAQNMPTWLLDEVGLRLSQSLGLVSDVLAEHMLEALFARFLYSSDFPADALRLIGSERMMPRYRVETNEQYRSRLKGAWVAWEFAGTRQAIESQFAAAGYTANVRENHQWDWDGDPDNWARFWVELTGHPWQRWQFGDGHVFGGGQTFGSTATVADITTIRQLVQQWKPGHVRCKYVIVIHDEDAWLAALPDGTWTVPENFNNFDDDGREVAAYVPGFDST